MAKIIVREGENIEAAIRRFSRKVDEERILKDYRENQYFIKPSKVRREMKKAALRKQKLKDGKINAIIANYDRK